MDKIRLWTLVSTASWSLVTSRTCDAPCASDEYKDALLVVLCPGGTCSGEINLRKGENERVITYPANLSRPTISMVSELTDMDLELEDPTGNDGSVKCVAGASCHDAPSQARDGCSNIQDHCLSYEGMSWYYTGDRQIPPVTEEYTCQGQVTRVLDLRVRGSSGGVATLTAYNEPLQPCPALLPGCRLCSEYQGCGPLEIPMCNGSSTVVCLGPTTTSSTVVTMTATSTGTMTTRTLTSSATTTSTFTETSFTRTMTETTKTATGTSASSTMTSSRTTQTSSVTSTSTYTFTKSTATSTTTSTFFTTFTTVTTTLSTYTVSATTTTTVTCGCCHQCYAWMAATGAYSTYNLPCLNDNAALQKKVESLEAALQVHLEAQQVEGMSVGSHVHNISLGELLVKEDWYDSAEHWLPPLLIGVVMILLILANAAACLLCRARQRIKQYQDEVQGLKEQMKPRGWGQVERVAPIAFPAGYSESKPEPKAGPGELRSLGASTAVLQVPQVPQVPQVQHYVLPPPWEQTPALKLDSTSTLSVAPPPPPATPQLWIRNEAHHFSSPTCPGEDPNVLGLSLGDTVGRQQLFSPAIRA